MLFHSLCKLVPKYNIFGFRFGPEMLVEIRFICNKEGNVSYYVVEGPIIRYDKLFPREFFEIEKKLKDEFDDIKTRDRITGKYYSPHPIPLPKGYLKEPSRIIHDIKEEYMESDILEKKDAWNDDIPSRIYNRQTRRFGKDEKLLQ